MDTKPKIISYVPQEMYNQLEEKSNLLLVSKAAIIRMALIDFLKK